MTSNSKTLNPHITRSPNVTLRAVKGAPSPRQGLPRHKGLLGFRGLGVKGFRGVGLASHEVGFVVGVLVTVHRACQETTQQSHTSYEVFQSCGWGFGPSGDLTVILGLRVRSWDAVNV